SGMTDSARTAFQYVLQKKPDVEDASLAYSDLETYNNQYSQALNIVESGLAYHPSSEILLIKKARILAATKDYASADNIALRVLSVNPNNHTADSLHTIFKNALTNPSKQSAASSDELFKAARTAAFDQKNYALARELVLQVLEKSPDYSEARVFLGRIYTWSNIPDSARIAFQYILQKNPGYEDASVAYSEVESINKNYKQALVIVDSGITFHPNSEKLLLKKAHILQSLKEYKLANAALEQLLSINPGNTAARALQNTYKTELYDNRIGLGYTFTGLDKQFSQPWHLLNFDYGRVTKLGSITGRINYGNRFGLNAFQFEADAYPHISNTFYAYINLGFSGTNNVFPRTRAGFSLYANLPSAFEGELGFRYLKFSGDPVWIYTAYLGKYYQKWLFGARTFITPPTSKRTSSVSYSLTGTYFMGGKYDLIGGVIGYGLTPDDRNNIVQYNTDVQLKTFRMGIFYKRTISKQNALMADLTWLSQEYLPKTKGNQYQIGGSWLHFF
ncbi:MAG: repeat-containing protein, partial [Chitinophagaceae bacterium]|nr:repeat-containing protein [Chitinophagaceae bacterium]